MSYFQGISIFQFQLVKLVQQLHENTCHFRDEQNDFTEKPPKVIKFAQESKSSLAKVLSLNDPNACSESISGGKGASLAQMMTMLDELNADIPKGIILTTNAVQDHLEHWKDLQSAIEELDQTSCKLCSTALNTEERKMFTENLQSICEK